jgi:hypothetical protein
MFQEVTRELLKRGYSVRFRPDGLSMSPTIISGEAVTIEPVKAAEVRRGEIILYRSERGFIAHRVLAIEESAGEKIFQVKGDGCATRDYPVRAGQILGRAVCVERGKRRIRLTGRRAIFAFNLRRRIDECRTVIILLLSVLFSHTTHD